jgi:methionyl-tRNA formyltransferase
MIRAFNPWPSAYTSLEGKLLKIFWARVIKEEPPSSLSPATVVRSTPSELVVLTGENFLALEEVQLEGKKRLPVSEFLKGFAVKEGTLLGT